MHAATDEEENTKELKFGDVDFEKVQTLTNDEMYYLLTKRQNAGITNELVTQTYSYLERIATTKVQDELDILTMELGEKLREMNLVTLLDGKTAPLHAFEVASLANLIRDEDTTVDEVLGLVPSMSRFAPDQIEKVIELISSAKNRAGANL